MTGEIMGGEKYGGISPKPPIFPGNNFTCDFCSTKFFLNFKKIYSFLSDQDAFASTIINEDIWVFIVKLNRVFSLSLYIFTVNCVATKLTKFSAWIIDPYPQKPKKLSRRVFIMAGKIIDREKYDGLRPKPSLFLGHNNPE